MLEENGQGGGPQKHGPHWGPLECSPHSHMTACLLSLLLPVLAVGTGRFRNTEDSRLSSLFLLYLSFSSCLPSRLSSSAL